MTALTTTDPQSLERNAVLDEEQMLDLAGGDASLRREIAELALSELPIITRALGDSVRVGDTRRVGSGAHRLKGALSNLAAGHSLARARRMEEAAFAGDLGAVRAEIAPLEDAMEDLLRALERLA